MAGCKLLQLSLVSQSPNTEQLELQSLRGIRVQPSSTFISTDQPFDIFCLVIGKACY